MVVCVYRLEANACELRVLLTTVFTDVSVDFVIATEVDAISIAITTVFVRLYVFILKGSVFLSNKIK